MGRYVFEPFTFSNGIPIPNGAMIECSFGAIHYDDEYHVDASVFDPSRWSKMRENEGEGTKHQTVSTDFEYLPFGRGRHAWYARRPANLDVLFPSCAMNVLTRRLDAWPRSVLCCE